LQKREKVLLIYQDFADRRPPVPRELR
jgi:hypothetical protein